MEAIFTLPYPEFAVATILQKYFKKKEGYSIQIPLSRQQKGLDILVYNQKTKKSLSFQIKSSRSYKDKPKSQYDFRAWFRRFEYEKGLNDYYAFFILYEKVVKRKLDKAKAKKWWGYKFVVFNDKEMNYILRNIKTKKEAKPETFFDIGFSENLEEAIFISRGFDKPKLINKNLMKYKYKEILNKLK